MIRRHKLTIYNVLLAAGICLLLLGLYTTWWGSGQAAFHPRVAKGPRVPSAPILRDQQPLTAYMPVVHQDLFNPDRKGPEKKQTKHANLLEGHQLLGIIIIGDTRAALIGVKAHPRLRKASGIDVVYLGENWNGFKVEKITNDSVIFQGKDGRKALTFPTD